ncbi:MULTISPECIES: hypothetical protein [unclassified Trichocoleus]|nr:MULTISPECIES: hypothetical protein [unclassified Trichocoleus]
MFRASTPSAAVEKQDDGDRQGCANQEIASILQAEPQSVARISIK